MNKFWSFNAKINQSTNLQSMGLAVIVSNGTLFPAKVLHNSSILKYIEVVS